MNKDELDKLAEEMKNLQPSKASRQRGMNAAMSAFDTEFVQESAAQENTVDEVISQQAQGSTDAPRLTGRSTSSEPVQSFRSGIMSKLNNIFSFNNKATMLLGSCTAALMFAAVIYPIATDTPFENKTKEGFSQVANEVDAIGTASPKLGVPSPAEIDAGKDEIVVTGTRQSSMDNISDAPVIIGLTDAKTDTDSEKNKGGVKSVSDLLSESRSNSEASEEKFRARGNQPADKSFADGAVSAPPPPTNTTVAPSVLDTPARTAERVIPGVSKQQTHRIKRSDGSYETVTETVAVQGVTTDLITMPPVYKKVTETIVVQPASGDQFENYVSNPVTSAKETPVSTFSIDVDTASYSFLRASLNRGQIPPPSSIRLEEMINYFPYDYEAPTSADEPFKANVTVVPTPWNAETKLMHIGIKGYVPTYDEKPRSNIVLLIDTSGSMNQPNKLPLLINSFKLLLNTLDDDDTVSIVTYAGSAGTVLEPTSASNKSKINTALTQLRSGGSTAGAAGLELAYEKAAESFDEEGINRVILATDGDFNVGFSSPEEMKTFITKKRKTGIFLSVLGFGSGNYNDHLMQVLAQNGNGVAAYIDSLSEAHKVLADEAGSALITIAKDVKIQVEFNPETISEYRLIGYETRALKREDFNNDKVDAGEINSGHSVTAIYELTPVGSSAVTVDDLRYVNESAGTRTNGSDEFAFVKIRHKLPNSDTSTLQTFPVGQAQERSVQRASEDVRFAAAVAAVGQKLRGDTQLTDYSYQAAIKLASSARGDDDNGYRAEFIQLVRLIDSMER